jgi:hypothetical protein
MDTFAITFASHQGILHHKHEIVKTVFGDNATGRTHTTEMFSQFKLEETSVEDCEHSGPSSTGCIDENVDKVHKIINKDRQGTILEIAGRLCFPYGTCQ